MQGVNALVELRKRRAVPSEGVWIIVGDGRLDPGLSDGDMQVLQVNPEEDIDRLDLRCVVGLKVLVTADCREPQERAIRAVCAACVAAGAKRVAGVQKREGVPLDEVPRGDWLFDFRGA